ncbi:FAD-dependent oxidoreductase, partial [Actinotalea sp.]|uniref:FAD-dependent oxidoreductase n=1 Tax=Actinotalea sp. TaxID=1872145 RepID=UPI003566A714
FESMDDLTSLLLMLGIDDQVVPFPMSSGGANRLYFRGHAFTNAEAAADSFAIWSELYDLSPAERGIDPRSIVDTVFERILAANPQVTPRPHPRPPEFWQSFRLDCAWAGVPLNEWTLWGLLDAMGYSQECITLLSRLLGFNGTVLSEMNAGEAFQLLGGFTAEPRFATLENGFSTLPDALARELGDEHLHLGTTVDRIEAREGGGYTATCTTRHGESVVTTEIGAPLVVLALPRLALEQLYGASEVMQRSDERDAHRLWNALQATTNQALLKINLYYPTAWWGERADGGPPMSFGPNLSDLPLGTVYPFYAIDPALFAAAEYEAWLRHSGHRPSPEVRGRLEAIAAAKYARPAALTIYCDHLNISFWRALQQGGGDLFDSPMQRAVADRGPQTIHPATEAVVEAAGRLLARLFDTDEVPRPLLTSARIWSGTTRVDAGAGEQIGYGVHQWGLHADDRAVIEHLVEPLPGLFTCGEAYSDYQGWVEGALRSADTVLARGFGLHPISTVYREEHHRSPFEAITARHAARAGVLIRTHVDPTFETTALTSTDRTGRP